MVSSVAQPTCERLAEANGVGDEPTPEENAHATLEEHDGALVATFSNPEPGRRYGITFALSELTESHAFKEAQRTWDDALRWIATVSSVRSSHARSATTLHRKLTRAIHKELRDQLGKRDTREELSWISQGFLWDAASSSLQTIFGNFAPEEWSRAYHYGEDAVGHAFRFDSEATYDGQHNRSLIAQDSRFS